MSSVSTAPTPATSASAPQTQPAELLMQAACGHIVALALNVAARLRVADYLAAGPRSAAELAKATQTEADALYRVLRALASVGIFTEVAPRRFALTLPAELLRSDVPNSMHA